jgi:hypothetical protein
MAWVLGAGLAVAGTYQVRTPIAGAGVLSGTLEGFHMILELEGPWPSRFDGWVSEDGTEYAGNWTGGSFVLRKD